MPQREYESFGHLDGVACYDSCCSLLAVNRLVRAAVLTTVAAVVAAAVAAAPAGDGICAFLLTVAPIAIG